MVLKYSWNLFIIAYALTLTLESYVPLSFPVLVPVYIRCKGMYNMYKVILYVVDVVEYWYNVYAAKTL